MVIVVTSLQIDRIIVDQHLADSRQQVERDLNTTKSHLELNLYNNIQITKGLLALFIANPSLSQQKFALAAREITNEQTQLKNISVAPDFVVQYTHPLKGNENHIGLDLHPTSLQLDAALKAKKPHQLKLAGPISFAHGKTDFTLTAPIFSSDIKSKKRFWGLVSLVIDKARLYQQSGLLDVDSPIKIAIRRDSPISGQRYVIFGDPALFNQENITSSIVLPDEEWQIVAQPTTGWHALPKDISFKRFTLFAVALTLFLLIFAFLKASTKVSIATLKFKNLIESSAVPYLIANKKQQITFVNKSLIAIYGYTPEQTPTVDAWLKKSIPNIAYREHITLLWTRHFKQAQKSKVTPDSVEINFRCKDGSTRIALASVATSDNINSSEYPIILYDITERKAAEDALAKSEERWQFALEGNREGVWDWDIIKDEVYLSPQFNHMLGYEAGELGNDPEEWKKRIHPDDKEKVHVDLSKCLNKEAPYFTNEHRVLCKDGVYRWRLARGKVTSWSDELRPLRMIGTHMDISAQKIAEQKLQLSARVFSEAHEGIMITDANSLIVNVNPAFSKITGYHQEEVIGQNPSILSSGKQSREFYNNMWRVIHDSGHWQGEVWNRKKNGEFYAEMLTISTLLDNNGQIINYVGVFTDITDNKKQQEELALMAHYDVLTGLPNRALFTDRFHQAIAHSKRNRSQLAICFLDLDNFKPINDNYGHDVGDQLLMEVAKRIEANIREEDTVSRFGGDEFTLLLNDVESYDQCELTLGRILNTLATPFLIKTRFHSITASIGVTLYPDDDEDIDTLVRHADNAMYLAKQSGKHRYHFFDSRHDKQLVQKHLRLTEIQQALANNEFSLYYQPKVDMATGAVFGAEALIRWHHPEEGLIPPLDFLPLIDGTDLEIQIGEWVIAQAIQQLDSWVSQGIKLQVSVNIAPHHLQSEFFFKALQSTLARHPDIDPEQLQLEILESSVLSDVNIIASIIRTCQEALGVTVALDDFGTGYSSLTHLRSLTANTIKIDQSFVRSMLDDPSDYTIIDGIIGLANSFDRTVIAEGVETTEHGLMLLSMGCQQAQGYGISKPMPADEFPDWLSSYTPNRQWLAHQNVTTTLKESKLIQLKITTDQWKKCFISAINSEPEENKQWPISDGIHCHCQIWINSALKEKLFKKEDILRLSEFHNEFHMTSQVLQAQYQEGHIIEAREALDKFHASFNNMFNAIKACG
ncbi:MAG: EAL domain-containing protein [Cycloclasticus sp.]